MTDQLQIAQRFLVVVALLIRRISFDNGEYWQAHSRRDASFFSDRLLGKAAYQRVEACGLMARRGGGVRLGGFRNAKEVDEV
jgi:hypothetical protein